jgi:hypothetical protein
LRGVVIVEIVIHVIVAVAAYPVFLLIGSLSAVSANHCRNRVIGLAGTYILIILFSSLWYAVIRSQVEPGPILVIAAFWPAPIILVMARKAPYGRYCPKCGAWRTGRDAGPCPGCERQQET